MKPESPLNYADPFLTDGGEEASIQLEDLPREVVRFLNGEDLDADEDEPREWGDWEPDWLPQED